MNKILKTLTLIATFGLLVSCSKPPVDEEGPDEVAEQLSLPTAVVDYELDETDYDSLQEAPTSLIRIFYRRNDNNNSYSNYNGWRIWAWDSHGGTGWWREFTKYNEFGVICDIPVSEVAADGVSISELGTVFTDCASQTATWEGVYSKEPNNDVMCEISPVNPGGIQRIYVKSTTPAAFYSQESVFMSVIDYARIDSSSKIRLVINTPKSDFQLYKKRLSVYIGDQLNEDYSIEDFKISHKGGVYQAAATLNFAHEFDMNGEITVKYRVSENNTSSVKGIITSYYDTEEFNAKYAYSGNDLGVTFDNEENPSKTTFKVWSPVSSSMKLNIYNSGDYRIEETPTVVDMTLGDKGVWSATINENLDGKYYTYTVTNAAGTNEVVDPYAKSAGLNGRRGMVVNFTRLNKEVVGWANDVRPNFGDTTNASIYEIHVRDMTINPNSGVSEANRGHYLGLTEVGTTYTDGNVTVTTGLDHLAELGITHVQIQPTYDYSSVDESLPTNVMSKDNYNWGYDPQNYNALEGGYSSNPSDGECRIKEFKQMIMALHNKGINAIMDVVYNHTSSFSQSNFEQLVPNYYHRTRASGVPYNGSGCGNEMASERYMVNKFVRESCKFWTEEYHLAGFRFDLMGLMDNQVMIDIYNDCHALYDHILIFGEPWTGGSSKLGNGTDPAKLTSQQTIQHSLNQNYFAGSDVLVGAFSDGFRNSARGDNSPGMGFVTGDNTCAAGLVPGVKGLFNKDDTNVQPEQVINYVSCHDNYTLYDQLIKNIKTRDMYKAYSQAESLVFLSQGVAFMQEGEDFLRTKWDEDRETYIHNSYNVGDFVNNMDYALKAENVEMFNYFRDLIQYRKDHSIFHLNSRTEINSVVREVTADSSKGILTYKLVQDSNEYLVIHTVNSATIELSGTFEVEFANLCGIAIGTEFTNVITLNGNSSVVLKKI